VGKERKTKKKLREPINGLTHLVGGLLASVGLIVLLAKAARPDWPLEITGVFAEVGEEQTGSSRCKLSPLSV